MALTKKPTLDDVMQFAEDDSQRKPTKKTEASKSGQIPPGDVRLTANIRADLHLLLKMDAVKSRTTIGELIEVMIEDKYL